MTDDLVIRWRDEVTDDEAAELVASSGGAPEPGWWDRVRQHSLGWVTARAADGGLVGFVNVAWDGARHAFLVDTATHPNRQRQGIGTAVVRCAAEGARAAGCEWLHVDFEPHLERFYLESCGFRTTAAGLIRLTGG